MNVDTSSSEKGSMKKNYLKTKFLPSLLIILTSLALFLSTGSLATNYYISNSGNDSNLGTTPQQAWKTLQRVNNLVPKPGDSILFRRGDEWSGTVAVNMFGKQGTPIVYGAFGEGAKPKIYGSEKITGWTKHSGNIYKAAFNKEINQLFVDDKKMKVARFPNRGYAKITSVKDSNIFISRELPSGVDFSGAVWFGRTGYYHTPVHKVVAAFSGSIVLDEAPKKDLNEGEGFILMNKLAFLDEPGEWSYDSNSRTVYLWLPEGDSPDDYVVRGSVHEHGFYARNKHNIVVRDLEITQQAVSGIEITDCNNWSIVNNDILYPDAYGINSESDGDNLVVTGNNIVGVNHLAIQFRTNSSRISDNKILKTGLFDNLGITGNGRFYYGSALFIGGKNNEVSYNRIIDVNYNGVFFAGPANKIEYNFIENTCLVKGDGGGIYTTQPGSNPTTGSVIRYNIVINSVGTREGYTSGVSFGEGIYIDESAHGVTVEHNTIYKTSNAGIKLHKTDANVIKHNTIMDARYAIQILKSSGSTPARITHNIMYSTSNGCVDNYEPRQLLVRTSSANAVLEDNIYRNYYESKGIFRGEDYCSFDAWKAQTGYDRNSSYISSRLSTGEKEKLFYNDTKHIKTFELRDKVYKDIFGNEISGSFSLQPFTSKILIGTDFKLRAGN